MGYFDLCVALNHKEQVAVLPNVESSVILLHSHLHLPLLHRKLNSSIHSHVREEIGDHSLALAVRTEVL